MCTPREMVCARVQHLEVTAKQGMQHPALLRLLYKNGTSDSSMVHRYDIRDKHLRFRWPLLAFANALTTARDKGGAVSVGTHKTTSIVTESACRQREQRHTLQDRSSTLAASHHQLLAINYLTLLSKRCAQACAVNWKKLLRCGMLQAAHVGTWLSNFYAKQLCSDLDLRPRPQRQFKGSTHSTHTIIKDDKN